MFLVNFVTNVWIFRCTMSVLSKKYMDMTVMKKFIRICSALGKTERICSRKESVELISKELDKCPARLENLFYEKYGMSGSDMLEAFVKGYM